MFIVALLADLYKAFACIAPDLITTKLVAYGFRLFKLVQSHLLIKNEGL